LSFNGTEGFSRPFRFDLELVSESPDLDLEKLLHKQAFLAFDPQGNGASTARSTASLRAMPASA
jgi:type VI secretion system secreted protein VgrG